MLPKPSFEKVCNCSDRTTQHSLNLFGRIPFSWAPMKNISLREYQPQSCRLSFFYGWIIVENVIITLTGDMKSHFKPFHARDFFWYQLKTSENQRFSDVFRGIKRDQWHEMG